MSKKLTDCFNTEVFLGDVVVYGANSGLKIGVVTKFNPATFQIKTFARTEYPRSKPGYVNIPFDFRSSLIALKTFDSITQDILTDEEKELIDLDKDLRSI